MYLIILFGEDTRTYYGPFPSEKRASEYAELFRHEQRWAIVPLIVPNCVSVRLKY